MKDRCKLFCRVAGTTAYYQLKDRVIDGTPCGPDTYDICVQGLCRVCLRAPCFSRLHSKAILAHIPSDAVSFSLVARCQELHSKARISVFSIFCTSAASGLRSRAELKGQERQVRRVWRRQLIVQNSGGNL